MISLHRGSAVAQELFLDVTRSLSGPKMSLGYLPGRDQGESLQRAEIVKKALANFSDPLRRDQYFELYDPEIVLRGYGEIKPGIESVKRYYYGFWDAIPDARVGAEDMIEAPDKVVVRFSLTGTHRGRILGVEGTGKAIQLTGITILRFEEKRCVERWSVTDSLALAIQIGALSLPH